MNITTCNIDTCMYCILFWENSNARFLFFLNVLPRCCISVRWGAGVCDHCDHAHLLLHAAFPKSSPVLLSHFESRVKAVLTTRLLAPPLLLRFSSRTWRPSRLCTVSATSLRSSTVPYYCGRTGRRPVTRTGAHWLIPNKREMSKTK